MEHNVTNRKNALIPVFVAISLCLSSTVFISEAKADYVPPIGIPAPSFGINESHMMYVGQTYSAGGFGYRDAGNGPYTHYVDNTHPAATNVANPYGTAATPRADLFDGGIATLPPGSVVELHGGPYTYIGDTTVTLQGTDDKPIFIRSVDPTAKVVIQSNGTNRIIIGFDGSYAIVENCEFYMGARFRFVSGSDHLVLRFSEVHNPPATTLAGGAGVLAASFTEDIVIYNNYIHDNWRGATIDCHGVNISAGAQRIWVLENTFHGNSGDAFQAAHYASPAPRYVYVGKNVMHNDKENGVDLKTVHDIVVSQNTIYGYQSSPTSSGDAVVVGSNGVSASFGPKRSWLLFNDIYTSKTGIRVEGAVDCWLIGNTIHDIEDNGIQLDIKDNSSNINIIGNTIVDVGGNGLNHGWNDGATGLRFENNIISDVGTYCVDMSVGTAAQAQLKNNLFWDNGSNVRVRWGSASLITLDASLINAMGDSSGNIIADPLFINTSAKDYRIPNTSPAVNAGILSDAYQTFFDLYGIDIQVDFDEIARPQQGPWDIGSFEWKSQSQVLGSDIFYNDSQWDGNDPAANSADDGAIAPDKAALISPGTAAFTNYTSFSKGINGIMLDVQNLMNTPSASDFEFKVGNHSNPSWWTVAPSPTSVTLRAGEGVSGSDRITIIWPDNAIQNQWLEVKYLPTADVMYFGNAIGETGNPSTNAEVTPTDEVYVRDNPATLAVSPAPITHAGDFNRDKKVGPTDAVISRNNGTNPSTALQLVTLVENERPTVFAGFNQVVDIAGSASLISTVNDDGYPDPPAGLTTTWSKFAGPGTVAFANSSSLITTATFTSTGTYVLQLEADDGVLSATDTVQIDVFAMQSFFADDFEDDNLDGWTTTAGSFETFGFPGDSGYEVHALTPSSRMQAALTSTNLSNTVYISLNIRHTGGAPDGFGSDTGSRSGSIWFVDGTGTGFGLDLSLSQDGTGAILLKSTTNYGATGTVVGSFATVPALAGYGLYSLELVYNRGTDQVECFFNGNSMGTVAVSSAYRDFTNVAVGLTESYFSFGPPLTHVWGQLNVDDIDISNAP